MIACVEVKGRLTLRRKYKIGVFDPNLHNVISDSVSVKKICRQ